MLHKTRFIIIALILFPGIPEASDTCTLWIAKIVSVQGRVETQPSGDSGWRIAHPNHILCAGDKIRTLKNSRATLEFNNHSLTTLNQKTILSFSMPSDKKSEWWVDLFKGDAFFRSRRHQRLEIRTPFINAVHEGTEFLVAVNDQKTEITVFDGQVAAANKSGEIIIEPGFLGIAEKGTPPRVLPLTVHPKDAVQWTLYYPPVIDYDDLPETALTSTLRKTISLVNKELYFQALNQLESIPSAKQDGHVLILKASILLNLGQVENAESSINETLRLDARNSNAVALQSIIAVTKNKTENALELAHKAVDLAPNSAVAKIALSYAYQSLFEIQHALLSAQEATQLAPKNALAWARLAELQLSTGDRVNALLSAEKAKALNPSLAKTHIILGFVQLAQIEIDAAKTEFEKAVMLNSANPLARLGLGLVKIRQGDLNEGTRGLEIAVSLDPDNSLMRSYLGKANYEQKNTEFASTELSLAKEMDPKDPTPWFYDAILKQSINRPVEALHDMQNAIQLNDNRTIYRSKLLIDEDLASRSANISRIYDNLDFDRVALKEAWNSINLDITNFSAHRFLADSYSELPKHEIAQASELLQAQLLQPLNITPIQPQLPGENLAIFKGAGPTSLSANEYNPLFASNGAHLLVNGVFGSHNTIGDNAILSGIYDKLSVSFGQNYFQTDGFRTNDDYKQEVYNAFAQYAITPDFNVQAEFTREYIKAGDTPSRINGLHFDDKRQTISQNIGRIGLRYKIAPGHDLLFSSFYTDLKENETTEQDFSFLFPILDVDEIIDESNGVQSELQYIFHTESINLISGFGYLYLNSDVTRNKRFEQLDINFDISDFLAGRPNSSTSENFKTNYFNGYLYSNIQIINNLTTTLGLSVDSLDNDRFERMQVNPKVGVIWTPLKQVTLRGAVFSVLKRPLAARQTIEPTQVAGFNQFFDDLNGTRAWRYGLGADFQILPNLFTGTELSWREISTPLTLSEANQVGSANSFENQDESSYLAYLYWTPFNWLSFSSKYNFEKLDRDITLDFQDATNPKSISTHSIPLTLNLFHPNGLFAKLTGQYINQKVDYVGSNNTIIKFSENFWTFDTSIGYRLPKRYGILSVEIKNLLNNDFLYHDRVDASEPQLTSFTPERTVFGRFSVSF